MKWTLQQLTHAVQVALDTAGYNGQDSGRIRAVPDPRTLRYYTTLGLIDRPTEFRGRTAYYGWRHLLQVVAIKRLQSQGRSLVEVQQALAGADDARLESLAGLPSAVQEQLADLSQAERQDSPAAPARRPDFWAAPAADPTPRSEASLRSPAARAATVLSLAPGVRLILEGVDPRKLADVFPGELHAALDQLVRTLNNLGWTEAAALPPRDGEDDPPNQHPHLESEE